MNRISVHSPIGYLELIEENECIRSAIFKEEMLPDIPSSFLKEVKLALIHYFNTGKLNARFPLAPLGTDFQMQVWNELEKIPLGKTISYLDLALKCGGKTYTRAVASANGKNPISILIPCHRVIGSDGSLTGYAGGLHRKKYLLELEGSLSQMSLF